MNDSFQLNNEPDKSYPIDHYITHVSPIALEWMADYDFSQDN